jgi:hypothetical protein
MNDPATSKIQSLQAPYCYYAYAVSQDGVVDYMHYGYWESDTKTITAFAISFRGLVTLLNGERGKAACRKSSCRHPRR